MSGDQRQPDLAIGVEPGDPNNWPRTVARSRESLAEAYALLRPLVDEANEKFAISEFMDEREGILRRQLQKCRTIPPVPELLDSSERGSGVSCNEDPLAEPRQREASPETPGEVSPRGRWLGWMVLGTEEDARARLPGEGRLWRSIKARGPWAPFDLYQTIDTAGLAPDWWIDPLPPEMVVTSVSEDLARRSVTIEAVTPALRLKSRPLVLKGIYADIGEPWDEDINLADVARRIGKSVREPATVAPAFTPLGFGDGKP